MSPLVPFPPVICRRFLAFLILWVEGQLFKHVFNPLRDIVLALE